MKKLASALSMLALCCAANAATVTANFNVTVIFTPACSVGTVTDVNFGTYVAFTAAVNANGGFSLNCSRGVAATGTFAYDGAGLNGLIPNANLRYTLAAPTATAVAGATAATTTQNGTPETVNVVIPGTLPSQAGNVARTPAGDSDARSVTVTF
jgi:spore coat protein U-like protein